MWPEDRELPGWLCSDGETYDKVGGAFGFAVLPVLEDAQPGMMQLQGSGAGPDMAELMKPLVTRLETPYPNPFNPETVLTYSLGESGEGFSGGGTICGGIWSTGLSKDSRVPAITKWSGGGGTARTGK